MFYYSVSVRKDISLIQPIEILPCPSEYSSKETYEICQNEPINHGYEHKDHRSLFTWELCSAVK